MFAVGYVVGMPTIRTLGFTGTRAGLTPGQIFALRQVIANAECIVHGDCIGADAEAHSIALEITAAHPERPVLIRIRPCNLANQRAFCRGATACFPPEPPMVRNEKIVAESDAMVACVSSNERSSPRSGTWATIRRARAARKPLLVLWPSGMLVFEPDVPTVRRLFGYPERMD